MEFNTPYKRTSSAPEINYGKNHTETSGYITGKQQIDNLLNAGERLLAYRRSLSEKESFDFPEGVSTEDDIQMPIDRIKNLDMADVSLMQRENELALKQQELILAEQKANKYAEEKAAQIAAIKAEALAEAKQN